jgi:hypothetical protein
LDPLALEPGHAKPDFTSDSRCAALLVLFGTLNPSAKERVVYVGAALVAITVGIWIAQGSWLGAAMLGGFLVFAALAYFAPNGTHIAVLAVLVWGYILGNRGFAQLSPTRGLPLFPAEAGLAISGLLLLAQCCVTRRIPLLKDGLNLILVIWILCGAARIGLDIKNHGFAAVRDFAMVYYAVFFFIAQSTLTVLPDPSRWLHRTILMASALLLPMYFLFSYFPEFFTDTLTFRGVPLIFYKGDLMGTFLAVGSLAWYVFYEERPSRIWALLMCLALAGSVVTTDNRASLLALVVSAFWLGLGGRWRFLQILALSGVAGILVIVLWAKFENRRIADTPLQGLYEKALSLTDFTGSRTYSGQGALPKGDNNRFRVVWWATVIEDTVKTNPYVGVGFGYDLADQFLKNYYPTNTDEFTARSPHSIFVTIFARMGAVGLIAFLIFVVCMAHGTREAVRLRSSPHLAFPWCTSWALLTAACFGVVLEGPMGAVVFWIALGAGSAERWKRRNLQETEAEGATLEPFESASGSQGLAGTGYSKSRPQMPRG